MGRAEPPGHADPCPSCVRTPISSAFDEGAVLLELEPGLGERQRGRQLIDVTITVIVESDVSREIEPRARQLGRERSFRFTEVVVAVDKHHGVLIRYYPREAFDGD